MPVSSNEYVYIVHTHTYYTMNCWWMQTWIQLNVIFFFIMYLCACVFICDLCHGSYGSFGDLIFMYVLVTTYCIVHMNLHEICCFFFFFHVLMPIFQPEQKKNEQEKIELKGEHPLFLQQTTIRFCLESIIHRSFSSFRRHGCWCCCCCSVEIYLPYTIMSHSGHLIYKTCKW